MGWAISRREVVRTTAICDTKQIYVTSVNTCHTNWRVSYSTVSFFFLLQLHFVVAVVVVMPVTSVYINTGVIVVVFATIFTHKL